MICNCIARTRWPFSAWPWPPYWLERLLLYLKRAICRNGHKAPEIDPKGVLQSEHVLALGRTIFTRHLLALEVVGFLLLVALIGAALIVGKAEGIVLGPVIYSGSKAGPALPRDQKPLPGENPDSARQAQ